jgi:hypothetical protein
MHGVARCDIDGDAGIDAAVLAFDEIEEPGFHRFPPAASKPNLRRTIRQSSDPA